MRVAKNDKQFKSPDRTALRAVLQFARPYPIRVIGSLLNVPEADQPYLHRLADDIAALFFTSVSAEQQLQLAQSFLAMQHYVSDLVEQCRKEPQDDLASTWFL